MPVGDVNNSGNAEDQDLIHKVQEHEQEILQLKRYLADRSVKVWDKGVSMKEYISQKFEPGEDDKALSQVISKAISPRKASSRADRATTMVPAPNSADSKAPLLANTNEILEEENHGKILQPN